MSSYATASSYEFQYPGIGRLAYVGYIILLAVVIVSLEYIAFFNTPSMRLLLTLATIGGSIVLTVLRLKNIGKSGWWVLAQFVPILNIYIAFLTICAPAGYEDSKQLDTAGKVTLSLYLLCVIGIFLVAFL